ncbi:MAG: hypothetical protein QM676_06360 [Novosphingobium sp.]
MAAWARGRGGVTTLSGAKTLADDRTKTRGKRPIAWHPLFPGLLALWFSALFGLGTLAVRGSLLESLAVAGGIDHIVSAAAPPLGMKGRLIIAFALALLGGVIGAAIGTVMARSKPSARARRTEAAAARAAQAEAAAAAEAAQSVPAIEEDGLGYFDVSALRFKDSLKIAAEPATGAAIATGPEAAIAPEPAIEAQPERSHDIEPPRGPGALPPPEALQVPGGGAAARLTSATLDSLSHVELIERLALSLQKRREEGEAAPALQAAVLEKALADLEAAAPVAAQASPVPSYYPPAPEPATPRFTAPPPAVADEEPETGETPAAYGSLLGIPRPARDSAGPVALFPETPAAPRQDSADTERALRDALAALQRMSGAA